MFPQMVLFMTRSNHYIDAADLNTMFLTLMEYVKVMEDDRCICINSKRAGVEIRILYDPSKAEIR